MQRVIDLTSTSLSDPVARELEAEAIAWHTARGATGMTPHPSALLAPPSGGVIIARLGSEPAGCGGWYLVPMGGLAVITRVYVVSWARRQGVATLVLDEAERVAAAAGARYAWAETWTEAPEAMRMYHGRGYSLVPPPTDRPTASRAFVRRLP
jgi:GNAT superfamily N-acetyltransferase